MSAFVLPITVRTTSRSVDLLIELRHPVELAVVLAEMIRLAGLPSDSTLHLGIGPVETSWILGRPPLLAGCVLTTRPQDTVRTIGPVNLSCVAGPDAGGWVPLEAQPVEVGRSPTCDLSLDDLELSRRHARVSWSDEGLMVTDLDSVNGVRVSGPPRIGSTLTVPPGELVRLGASVLRAGLDSEPTLLLTPDGRGRVAVARPARIAPTFDHQLPSALGSAPERSRRPIPLLAAALGAVAGGAIAVVTGMWSFLLLAALGPVLMLATALSDRLSGRRTHRRDVADYRAAQRVDAEELESAVVADRRDAWDRYPDPATLARRAANCSTRLWERRPTHPDFLRLALGVGSRPSRVDRTDPPITTEVPITVNLAEIGVLGLAGECRPLLRHLLGQLAGLHSPADLHLSIFSDHPDLGRAQDLPHSAVDGSAASLPTGARAAAQLQRLPPHGDARVTVVILDDAHRWRRTAGMTDLLARAAESFGPGAIVEGPNHAARPVRAGPAKLFVICVSAQAEALPVECTAIATVESGRVVVAAGQATANAEATGVSAEYLDALVDDLAALSDPDTPGLGVPPEVHLSALFGGHSFREAVANGWSEPSMSVPFGLGASGTVTIDLEADGPHLLIAGTTGSGKSELLQTLIAGLACAAPPDRTAFLLIDYKGGAAFGPLGNLAHTTGMVTDLDAALAVRALRSLHAEVRRRERFLAAAGASDLKALRNHRASASDSADRHCADGRVPPSLVIVVDEFATLGAELPEFLRGLLDVAQRGRSLGLHLVLATQRPAGVLSPAMKANIGLRICLRVTDDADSVDVIDTPAAARLSGEVAGRAWVRYERSRITLVQVARVSGAARRGPLVRLRGSAAGDHGDSRKATPGVGTRSALGTTRSDLGTTRPDLGTRSELDEIVEAVTAAAAGMPRPAPPWLPALPQLVPPTGDQAGRRDVIGILDRPAEQLQPLLRIPAASVLVLGPPASGRSCALRRFGWMAAADGAQVLVIDPGRGLADLSSWPGVRSHLDGQDPVLVQRLVHRLQAELRTRNGVPGPPVLLLVDGWDLVSGPLDALDYGATSAAITDLAGRGPSAGIRVVLSGDPRLAHHRIAGAFGSVLRFGVDDRGDVMSGPPGRGRCGPDEMQVVHCPAGISAPATEPIPQRGITVRPLPVFAQFLDLPAAAPEAVPIGFGGDDAGARTVDLTGAGGLLVAGPRRSGVTTALGVLATAAAAAGIPVLRAGSRPSAPPPSPFCVTGVGPPHPGVGCRDVDIRDGFDALRRLLVDHQGPLLLVADEVDSWPSEGEALLARFVTVAGVAQNLAVGARLDRAVRCSRGPIAELAALRTGLLLHADSTDGSLLDAVLPRRRGSLPAGRGHLVSRGQAVPIQVANL